MEDKFRWRANNVWKQALVYDQEAGFVRGDINPRTSGGYEAFPPTGGPKVFQDLYKAKLWIEEQVQIVILKNL